MKIIPLIEGSFTIDQTKKFIPFDLEKDDLKQRAGSLLVEIQPFVVITSKDILLIDAGLGFTNQEGNLQLYQNLIDHNINPGEITKVLMSHLHKDHAGGISFTDSATAQQLLSFPNATYYVQKREFDLAMEKETPSYIHKEISLLQNANNVIWLADDNGTIDDYIHYQVTAGHSPMHQVFWIHDEGDVVFFGGDDAPQLNQMKSRFVAKYDYDGKKCMELRQEWWAKGERENWTFLFYHDVKEPVWKFS